VPSSASSRNLQYPLFPSRTSSNCFRLLSGISPTYFLLFIFPSLTYFRRQSLRRMWQIKLNFFPYMECRIFFSLTLCNIFLIPHTVGPPDRFCLQRKHLKWGKKLSGKRNDVLFFPLHFHIAVHQSSKPLWPCLLLQVKRLSHTLHYPTAVCGSLFRNTHSIVKAELSIAQKGTYYCEVCYKSTFEYLTFSEDGFLNVAINYITAR